MILTEHRTSVGAAYLFEDNRAERRWTMLLTLAIALMLHLGLVLVVPPDLLMSKSLSNRVTEAELEIEFVPPVLIPPDELKFVEANPEAPENKPDRQDQYSFRDQQAADMSEREELLDAPDVEGEEDSQKIVQGLRPKRSTAAGTYSPVQPGEGEGSGVELGTACRDGRCAATAHADAGFLQQEARRTTARPAVSLQGDAQELVQHPTRATPIQVYKPTGVLNRANRLRSAMGPAACGCETHAPRAAAFGSELIGGPLMRSVGAASRRGSLAIDATFSEFGEYQQQFFAALQLGWYQEIEFFQPIDTAARVLVRFTMKADGSIHAIETLHSSASEMATVICESAISKRSPFRPWTKEMVEVFGESDTDGCI